MKIDFEVTDGTYYLRDAIVLPDDHALTEQDIENIKQKRFNDFVELIKLSEAVPEENSEGNVDG